MSRKLLIVFSVLMFTSCISPTEYYGNSKTSYDGFEVTKISEKKYKVLFRGNEETSQQRAKDFAFLRAAQEADSKGFSYLSVARVKSTTTTQRSKHKYDKSNFTPIAFQMKDGSVVYTQDYGTEFGTASNKYSITRPHVMYIVEFFKNNYDQDIDLFVSEDIIREISEKYDIKMKAD